MTPLQAYAPLRPRRLLWQLVVVGAAEVLLFAAYSAQDAPFHWATHFLVGLVATALWLSAVLLATARPARLQLLPLLGFHLWALWPDLAFRAGVPHERWMDWAALGHVSSHYLPGADEGWLAVALVPTAAYGLLLSRWLAARRAEAVAGMTPAVGIGGAAVLRPQLDPRTAVLAHERFGPPAAQAGEPLVLLHGLGATSSTWTPTGRRLGESGSSVLVPDLLGFGASMRLGTDFGTAAQAQAVLRLLDDAQARRVHVVAHSWGSTVAAAVARSAPERVARVTLVAPAVFTDVPAAQARFARRSTLARVTLSGSRLGRLACNVMCLARPLLARLAPRIEPDIPADVARHGVQHSYAAYAAALDSMWTDNPVIGLLQDPPCPVTVVLAEQDETVLLRDVLDLPPAPQVRVVQVPGTHGIAYEQPDLMTRLLLEEHPGASAVRP